MVVTDIDSAEFESWLSRKLGAVVTGTEVLHDGLNLSVAVSTAETERAFVLRKPNKLRERSSFNDVTQEYRVMRELQDTGIEAPKPVFLCTDDSLLGDPFLVMTYLDGETISLGSDLPERFRTPTARSRLAVNLVDTLAELHSVDVDTFVDICERRPVRKQVTRVVEQFDDATRVTTHEHRDLWRVADWLRENVPEDSQTSLVHGDYRPGNVLFAEGDRPDIIGVLDWETAFLGDPLVELGYLLLRWRDDGDPTPSLEELSVRDANEEVLEDLRRINEQGLAPFTNDPGSPSRRELVARYEAKTGFTFEQSRFYRAFSAFILAAVWEDLHRYRIEAGEKLYREPYIDYVSMVAASIVDGEFQL